MAECDTLPCKTLFQRPPHENLRLTTFSLGKNGFIATRLPAMFPFGNTKGDERERNPFHAAAEQRSVKSSVFTSWSIRHHQKQRTLTAKNRLA